MRAAPSGSVGDPLRLKAAAVKEYVDWCLTVGQEYSESLGYLRLPPSVVIRAEDALGGIS
jgi:ABC-type phosphate transport system substrate-binding protein